MNGMISLTEQTNIVLVEKKILKKEISALQAKKSRSDEEMQEIINMLRTQICLESKYQKILNQKIAIEMANLNVLQKQISYT